MSNENDDGQDVQVSIILDDPQIERYIVKTLAAGDEDEIEAFLNEGKNGFEDGRYQEALRSVHAVWEREVNGE